MTHMKPWLIPVALVVGVCLGAPCPAQEPAKEEPAPKAESKATPVPSPPGPRPGDAQKVFVVEHVNPDQLARLLRVFPAQISAVDRGGLRALAVSAKPAVLAAIEETIKRLDRPGADSERTGGSVDLTGYILEGLADGKESEPLPGELEPVVAQLRRTFKYTTYRLFDTVVARARADGSRFSVNGVTEKRISRYGNGTYLLSAQRTSVVGDNPRTVRLGNFQFVLEIPIPVGLPPADNSRPLSFSMRNVGLQADLDVPDGRFVVVGKTGSGDAESTLLLVLTAKVVD
jgi:hypothetical protein